MSSPNVAPVTVYISDDPSTLGSDAAEADLDRYAGNLADHLAEQFGRPIEVETTAGLRGCPTDEDIHAAVVDIESGDAWSALAWPETEADPS